MKKPQIKDWVRFYREGNLVVGEVQYIHVGSHGDKLFTDAGPVCADQVLETRPPTGGGA